MQNWKCVLWDLLLIQYIRRIFKAFEPRLLIHNGFSLVDYINSMCCFSKRVYAMENIVFYSIKLLSLKNNHNKLRLLQI